MNALIEAHSTVTKRHTSVDSSTGVAIKCAEWALKGVVIHIEGSTPVATMTGTLACTGSAAAVITSDGTTITLDGKWPANTTITTIKAPSGTINVSIVGWR